MNICMSARENIWNNQGLGAGSMEKLKRTDRLVLFTRLLTKNPNVLYSLTDLAALTGAAKSTISEDINIIKEVMGNYALGELVSVAGAAGGVKFKPVESPEDRVKFLHELARKLSDPERIIPGGFVYMTDVIYDPGVSNRIGEIFFSRFQHTDPDYIVSVETKGIPLAMMTARCFNVPLVIIRHSGHITEGSSVNINYVSGSTKNMRTMSLAKRALKAGSKVLVIDDFMKGGGTAKGIRDLMEEFNSEVVGIGVVVATKEPQEKLVQDYFSLLELVFIDESHKNISMQPAAHLIHRVQ
jgi:purine operon repressor